MTPSDFEEQRKWAEHERDRIENQEVQRPVTTTDQKFLADIRALAEAATPGPWENVGGEAVRGGPFHKYSNGKAREQVALVCGGVYRGEEERQTNASFIAASRTAIPRLLGIIEEQSKVGLRVQYLTEEVPGNSKRKESKHD